jgi:hypothetical protein
MRPTVTCTRCGRVLRAAAERPSAHPVFWAAHGNLGHCRSYCGLRCARHDGATVPTIPAPKQPQRHGDAESYFDHEDHEGTKGTKA